MSENKEMAISTGNNTQPCICGHIIGRHLYDESKDAEYCAESCGCTGFELDVVSFVVSKVNAFPDNAEGEFCWPNEILWNDASRIIRADHLKAAFAKLTAGYNTNASRLAEVESIVDSEGHGCRMNHEHCAICLSRYEIREFPADDAAKGEGE